MVTVYDVFPDGKAMSVRSVARITGYHEATIPLWGKQKLITVRWRRDPKNKYKSYHRLFRMVLPTKKTVRFLRQRLSKKRQATIL